MQKTYSIFVYSAVGSYVVKFIVDLVMLIYSLYGLGDIYYDDYYLFIPQIISALLLLVFYSMFLKGEFYGIIVKLLTLLLMFVQVAFCVMMVYDRRLGYEFYFSVIAAVNFFNSLFVKCNIIPIRDTGDFEYGPMVFELTSFVVMAVSIYSFFAAFPISFNEYMANWERYDIDSAIKLNIICDFVMIIVFFVCLRNSCKYIRDMVIDEDYMIDEIQ